MQVDNDIRKMLQSFLYFYTFRELEELEAIKEAEDAAIAEAEAAVLGAAMEGMDLLGEDSDKESEVKMLLKSVKS